MNEKMQRLCATIHGRVQGVGFRYYVIESVRDLNLTGWVRNRYDGSVEVLAEGSREDLYQLLLHLKRGSRSSNVIQVSEKWLQATGEFSRFTIRRDG